MITIDLHFFSRLSSHDTRREAARELASLLGASDLFIFDWDQEVGRFLASPCFPQTYPRGMDWQDLLARCEKAGSAKATLPLPGDSAEHRIKAIKIDSKVIFCLVDPESKAGPETPQDFPPDLAILIENLGRLLQSERLAKQHEAQNHALRELTSDLSAYSSILSRTRGELHDALDEVSAQRADLQAFFDQVTTPMTVLIGPEHRYQIANSSYHDLIGENVIGKTVAEVFSGKCSQPNIKALDDVYLKGEPYFGKEVPMLFHRPDGSENPLRLNIRYSPFRGTDGSVKGVLVYIEDVTAQYESRIKIEDLAREAQLANQAKSQFLANMSHEIRTPMNAILGFSDLMRDHDLPSEDRNEFLRRIRANGDHLLALIDDVLDLSRIESGKMSFEKLPFSIVEVLSELHASFNLLAKGRAVDTKLELSSAVPATVISDPTRVRQVVTNLISNAVKFTDSGKVEIRIDYESTDRPKLNIEVQDTGIGISEDIKPHLFKPFQQADDSITRRFGGTGLGLALSKRIAEALGGTLELKSSRLGQGSIFKFTLPVTVENSATMTVTKPGHLDSDHYPAHSDVLSGVRLLLAEDSSDNRAVIKAFLRNTRVNLTFAENGAEAVEKALHEDFDMILMDVQMPKLDGLSATKCLREAGYLKPIVALTAHALPEEVQRSLASGCNGHLTKPIGREALISAILDYTKN